MWGAGAPSSRPHPGGLHVHFRCRGSLPGFALARGPATPPPGGARGNPGGSARHVSRKRAGRPRHEASRGPARWAATQARGNARVAAQVSEGGRAGGGTERGQAGCASAEVWPSRLDMLPWTPRRWGAGEEQAPRERRPSAGSGLSQAWDSRENALGEQGGAAQGSPQPWPRRLSWTRKEKLRPRLPPGLVAKHSLGTPVPYSLSPCLPPPPAVPFSPQRTWGVTPSKMTLLAPWDPNYEATAGCRLVWGPSCASGVSFSGRTLSHPSFWPLYQAASCRDLRPSLAGHQSEEQVPRAAGFPVMCSEDIFFLDPLLPRGQRVPLYLSEVPQQVMGSLKLLLPRPIMSPWLLPIPSSGCSTTWLSGPELIALTGLLQMSQGEPRPSSSGAPGLPSGPPAPASDHPAASGGPGCSHCGEPSLPGTPDAQGL
ncbi:PREDICTED: histone deacetylase complex subunit SAP25 [Capra hircus]|uniref:histone deacetylase complex subunit SAP25 n=1 Tax=Capra hircus TaxID=9925 RepID=UPI00084729F8|nr:PREDICTED: histone deacetylase complex subunit SAP25 [Capra hircus]